MGALEEALKGLLRDGILRSSSSIAVASRQAAEGLLESVCDDCNKGSVEIFTSEVLKLLDDD